MPQIVSSFLFHVALSLFFFLLYLYLDIRIYFLFSAESHQDIYTSLYPNICLYGS